MYCYKCIANKHLQESSYVEHVSHLFPYVIVAKRIVKQSDKCSTYGPSHQCISW